MGFWVGYVLGFGSCFVVLSGLCVVACVGIGKDQVESDRIGHGFDMEEMRAILLEEEEADEDSEDSEDDKA